jgi:hypothetical protein
MGYGTGSAWGLASPRVTARVGPPSGPGSSSTTRWVTVARPLVRITRTSPTATAPAGLATTSAPSGTVAPMDPPVITTGR